MQTGAHDSGAGGGLPIREAEADLGYHGGNTRTDETSYRWLSPTTLEYEPRRSLGRRGGCLAKRPDTAQVSSSTRIFWTVFPLRAVTGESNCFQKDFGTFVCWLPSGIHW
ncbi:MAG: hypothetical protein JWN09_1231 [Microbacteriaceae bacterium]|nr:hypothetical protein [Microbacteriaceae bacterium]